MDDYDNEVSMHYSDDKKEFIHEVAEKLSTQELLRHMYHEGIESAAMPSVADLKKIVDKLRAVIFPGYFGPVSMRSSSLKYHIGALLDEVYCSLAEQIRRGYCFECADRFKNSCHDCEEHSFTVAKDFLEKLPDIRHMLSLDARAGFEGDPASRSIGEVIYCYPSMRALTNHRIAHELFLSGVPLIPRIISELAHSETGIDIHPGARIGRRFFIDHGTGVVIGETCVIGENVRIYQGVTLGAKSFPLDSEGNPIKGIDRHPKVGDNVVIYSGATILGTVMIGEGAQVGGNVWITRDVAPGEKVRANF